MYSKYFGLKEPSFSIAPDPQYLFLSEQHKEALAHLLYGAGESGGFVLLTGEVGTGKTTVCRAFLEQIPEGVDVALILNPAMTANELLLGICDEFRIPVPEGERSVKLLVDRLNRYLLEAHANGRRPLLMIDEAQNLRPKVLEQIRLLTNLETTKHKLLQIFLVGQPELRRMLEREGLRQLDQRITARFHLRPLSLGETVDYIRHRVAVAGVDRPLFTARAVRRIHQLSGGIPRLINILCDRALLGACVTRVNQVTPAIVATAAREVQGERKAVRPTPVVRPAFAVAAVATLLLVAGWRSYDWLIQWVYRGEPVAEHSVGGEAPMAAGPQGAPAGESLAAAGPGRQSDAAPPPAPAAIPDAPAETPVALAAPASPAPGGTEEAAAATTAPEGAVVVTSADQDGTPDPVAVAALTGPGPSGEALPQAALASFTSELTANTLERLAMREEVALRVLLRRWGLTIQDLGGGDPCARALALGLRCERERGRLSNVRYFDRPVLLRVGDRGGEPRYLALGGLDLDYATLDLESGAELVPAAELESIWSGDYTVVWRPPPSGAPLIGPGASADSVQWLRRLMAEVPDGGLAYLDSGRFDAALAGALKEFQRSRGLAPDGIAGPRTLIQLHNVADTPGIPRLMPADTVSATLAPGDVGALSRTPGSTQGRDLP